MLLRTIMRRENNAVLFDFAIEIQKDVFYNTDINLHGAEIIMKPFRPIIALFLSLAALLAVVLPSTRLASAENESGTLVPIYRGASYTVDLYNAKFIGGNDGKLLTDLTFQKMEKERSNSEGWLRIKSANGGSFEVTVTADLGAVREGISVIYARTMKHREDGCDMAKSVSFYVSEDGKNYKYIGDGKTPSDTTEDYAAALYKVNTSPVRARYYRAVFRCGGKSLFINEFGAAARGRAAHSPQGGSFTDVQGVEYLLSGSEATVVALHSRSSSPRAEENDLNVNGVHYIGKGTENEVKVVTDLIGEKQMNYAGVPNTVRKIMIHNTATVEWSTDAELYNERLHNMQEETSWHYTVDSGVIYHSLADDIVGWHAGGPMNYTTIGIEICTNGAPTYGNGKILFSGAAYDRWVENTFRPAFKNAAVLTAELLVKYGLGLDDVAQHYDSSRKECPLWMRRKGNGFTYNGTLWVEFMEYVKEYYNILSSQPKSAGVYGEITLPDYITDPDGNIYTLTSVGGAAFSQAEGITSVTLSRGITHIAPDAFEESGIERINTSENGNFTFENGVIRSADGSEVAAVTDTLTGTPQPKEGCALDIRTSGAKHFAYLSPGTTLSRFESEYGAISLKARAANGAPLGVNDELTTGASAVFGECRIYAVIPGDGTGDGKIDSSDYLFAKRLYLGTIYLSESRRLALCVTGGKCITALDYLLLKRHVLGTYNIYSK